MSLPDAAGEPRLELEEFPASIPLERKPVPSGRLSLYWLGQAGFLIETPKLRIVIDAYLSDSLAAKYKGKEFPHVRMAPSPVDPGLLRDIDYVFSTHAHTDHMDPETIVPLAAANPGCTFVVPLATSALALERGVPRDRLMAMDAGDRLPLARGGTVIAIPSAHEVRERDSSGHERFLGYIFDLDGISLYHSGDCVPYPGLVEILARYVPSIFLLPINGRDSYRSSKGILGNFTLEEAIGLASNLKARFLLGHHFGLFDFNTIDREKALATIAETPKPERLDIRLASPQIEYRFSSLPEDV